jgi:hypothetical protein
MVSLCSRRREDVLLTCVVLTTRRHSPFPCVVVVSVHSSHCADVFAAVPMDRLRLVMPPTLFAALSYPFTRLAYLLFPVWMANGIISGSFAFYVLYDTMHYGECIAHLLTVSRLLTIQNFASAAPHQAPQVYQGHEDVSHEAPLCQLRARVRGNECVSAHSLEPVPRD